jgi:SGNH domain (fused to AT3 domains)
VVFDSPRDWALVLGVLLGIALVFGIGVILLEQPTRVGRFTRARPWSVLVLALSIVAILASVIAQGDPVVASRPVVPKSTEARRASLAEVLELVAESNKIRSVPSDLVPPVSEAVTEPASNAGWSALGTRCFAVESQATVPSCTYGDRNGTRTVVLYGDSHAAMWFHAIDDIATRAGWRLIVLSKAACLAAPLPTHYPTVLGDWVACDEWHRFAVQRINRIDPDVLIVTQSESETPQGIPYTPVQWRRGVEQLLRHITAQGVSTIILGDIPPSRGPECLARYDDVRGCSERPSPTYNNAERLAAAQEKARYINVTPWFCASKCSPVIGDYDVYFDAAHVAVGYSVFLEGVLAQKLDLSKFGS